MRIAACVVATLTLLPACRSKPIPKADGGSTPSAPTLAPPTEHTCGVGPTTLLTDSGIGGLQVGASTTSIKQRCSVLADTTELGDEADSQRVLLVRFGPDTVEATIDNDRVWRIEVTTPRFRSADSLGVGSRVSAFRRFHDLKAESGEGPYYLYTASHCGMSFALPWKAVPDSFYAQTLEGAALNEVADTLRVESVLVFGCHGR